MTSMIGLASHLCVDGDEVGTLCKSPDDGVAPPGNEQKESQDGVECAERFAAQEGIFDAWHQESIADADLKEAGHSIETPPGIVGGQCRKQANPVKHTRNLHCSSLTSCNPMWNGTGYAVVAGICMLFLHEVAGRSIHTSHNAVLSRSLCTLLDGQQQMSNPES